MITDHLICAIEDIDVEVANLNAQIDSMRERVDVLVDLRVSLVAATSNLGGSPPPAARVAAVPSPPKKQPDRPRARPRATKTNAASNSKYDLAEIAAIATEAASSGTSATEMIIARTECPTTQMARYLMTSARAAGHDIPRLRGGPRPPKATNTPPRSDPATSPGPRRVEAQVTGKVFSCTDCDQEFPEVIQIARHCRLNHGRDAAAIERSPTESAVA